MAGERRWRAAELTEIPCWAHYRLAREVFNVPKARVMRQLEFATRKALQPIAYATAHEAAAATLPVGEPSP